MPLYQYADQKTRPVEIEIVTQKQMATQTQNHLERILPILQPFFICPLLLTLKLLLIPSYKSTDFDVHRNWLAITHHLPVQEWYYDDQNGGTVHTLDYPPTFAFFEYLLSNNPITMFLVGANADNDNDHRMLDSRCLALLPDDDNQVGYDCVVFQRCTVILSDIVFWIGAWFLCKVLYSKPVDDPGSNGRANNFKSTNYFQKTVAFTLIVCNPGLILLDNIHFQYNGMLLGILLLSIAFLIRGIQLALDRLGTNTNTNNSDGHDINTTSKSTNGTRVSIHKSKLSSGRFPYEDIIGAILFATLLTMKHLYLTLVPFYTAYLFRKFCFVHVVQQKQDNLNSSRVQSVGMLTFSPKRLLLLGIIVLTTLIIPFLPFLDVSSNSKQEMKANILQMLSRLFPFQRGLCHDYWAGNIWALYLGLEKVTGFLIRALRKLSKGRDTNTVTTAVIELLESYAMPFPEVTPLLTASLLILSMIPSMICAWKAATIHPEYIIPSSSTPQAQITKKTMNQCQNSSTSTTSRKKNTVETILYSIVFSSLSSFMLAYHVHEKAIMTSIIPMTVLAISSKDGASLYLRLMSVGHFGLIPLLFQPAELVLKIFLNVAFFLGSVHLLNILHTEEGKDETLFKMQDKIQLFSMTVIAIFAEVFHPIWLKPKQQLEFLPLMIISTFCAVCLVRCWMDCGRLMFRRAQSLF